MRITLLTLILASVSCRSAPDHSDAVHALIDEGAVLTRMEPALEVEIVKTKFPPQDNDYFLGTGDVLDVQVEGHPQFSVRAGDLQRRLLGFRVQRDGRVYLPLLGGVQARGLTPLDLREELTDRLAELVVKPNVAVDVLAYESQKFFILGAVRQPGAFPVDGRKTLLEGVGLAGGVRDDGDVENAYIVRGRALLPVSLGDILLRGNVSRNIRMRDGDLLYVPTSERWQVYVLGEVMKPGAVQMPRSGLSLAAALAAAGGFDLQNADKDVVRIFRGSWQAPQSFTVGADDIYRYGAHIKLKPGDLVHVAPRGLATFNRALTLLMPIVDSTLTAATLAAAIEN